MVFRHTLEKVRNSINAKIIFVVFALSGAVTIIITGFQLFWDYHEELREIDHNVQLVESTFKGGVEEALWNFDITMLRVQTSGILNIPGFRQVFISSWMEGDSGKLIHSGGRRTEGKYLVRKIDLSHAGPESPGPVRIGQLELHIDLTGVYIRLWKKAGIILLTQFLKTLMVSGLVLYALNRILTRHLLAAQRHLIEQAEQASEYTPLKLPRDPSWNDEIKSLEDSINRMQSLVRERYEALAELNETLERKVVERTKLIAEQQEKLQFASKMLALGEMAGGIAHEINSPLTVISLLSHDSLRIAEKLKNERLRSSMARVLQTVDKIGRITSSLRGFASEASQEGMALAKVSTIINDAVFLGSMRGAGSDTPIQVEPYTDVEVYCRASVVSQVLLGLIYNAINAVAGQPERWISIEVEFDPKNVRISVSDSSRCLPDELVKKMFLPLAAHDFGKTSNLGLNTFSNIINDNGGTLSYDCARQYTRFIVELSRPST
ncbi:MAG: hypothetical protein NDJ89_11420 [Oligoflexia bacterium]|nr:hypothetical protein [Oligoflexia bacterium]